MVVEKLKRVFKFSSGKKDIELADPNPEFSPEEVLKHYMNAYPELTNSNVMGPEVGSGKLVFTFKSSVGTKG